MTNIEAAKIIRHILERNNDGWNFDGIVLDKNDIAALNKAVKTLTKEHTRSANCNQTRAIERW